MNSIRNVASIFNRARVSKSLVGPHANIIQANRTVEVETSSTCIGQLSEVGWSLTLIITVELTRAVDGK
jgi:hypothetical protein